MITLSKFEHLIMANITQKPQEIQSLGSQGEYLEDWVLTLSGINKHQQYAKLKLPLSELLVATADDKARLTMTDGLLPAISRTIEQLHADYIYEQAHSPLQQQSISQVRSLYFFLILIYKNIASRAYIQLHEHSSRTENWLSKLIKSDADTKEILALATYRMIELYVKVLREYALTYECVPRVIWQQLNFWYLRSVHEGIFKLNMGRLTKANAFESIHNQYKQAGIASFVNFFAYRRQDILSIFKVLPEWTKYIDTTFEPKPQLKVFVNLSGNHPPEMITPYATVNPYSEEHQCLFFDVERLITHLNDVVSGNDAQDTQSIFDVRLARVALLAFRRRARQDRLDKIGQTQGELLTGFASVFAEISGGKSLAEIINQRTLPVDFHAKALHPTLGLEIPKEFVKITSKNERFVRFDYRRIHNSQASDQPFLKVLGIFALKAENSPNKRPWKVATAQWVNCLDDSHKVEVDGCFLGRALLAVGLRLKISGNRDRNFIHALLVEGDEIDQPNTLIVPCYHFLVGDVVVLRIGNKEMDLRLEQRLLTTNEIEQYQIVRLNG